jgi:hypothetical protein
LVELGIENIHEIDPQPSATAQPQPSHSHSHSHSRSRNHRHVPFISATGYSIQNLTHAQHKAGDRDTLTAALSVSKILYMLLN